MSPPKRPVVIIGGGVIGMSAAYFLSLLQPGREIHILESASTLFPSASSRAAGFLAKDWFSSSAADLGALSFELHKRLAEQHSGAEKWGYSGSVGLCLITRQTVAQIGRSLARGKSRLEGCNRGEAAAAIREGTASGSMTPVEHVGSKSDIPRWLSLTSQPQVEVISQPDSTAQINPLRFCRFLMGECIARGVQLHLSATATRVLRNPDTGLIVGVDLSSGISLPCSQILVAAGAWTPGILKMLFPNINPGLSVLQVSSLAGYSVIYRKPRYKSQTSEDQILEVGDSKPPEEEKCHAVFTTNQEASFSPEMFSRREGDIYVAGLNTPDIPLPPLATDVEIPGEDHPEIKRLRKAGEQFISLTDLEPGEKIEVVTTGLCHRPSLPNGKPIVGKIKPEDLDYDYRLEGFESAGALASGGRSTQAALPAPPRRGRTGSSGGGDNANGALNGVYACVGHGPWGISLSLGSGLVMAEMLAGRPTSADVSLLAPR